MKLLLSEQLFPKSIWLSRAGNSYVKGSVNWAKVQLVSDLMPVFIFCKFDEDSINKRAIMALYRSSEDHSTKGT